MVDNRCEPLASGRTDICDRARSAFHFRRCKLAFTRFCCKAVDFIRDFENGFTVGIFHYRHKQAFFGIRRNSDVEVMFWITSSVLSSIDVFKTGNFFKADVNALTT